MHVSILAVKTTVRYSFLEISMQGHFKKKKQRKRESLTTAGQRTASFRGEISMILSFYSMKFCSTIPCPCLYLKCLYFIGICLPHQLKLDFKTSEEGLLFHAGHSIWTIIYLVEFSQLSIICVREKYWKKDNHVVTHCGSAAFLLKSQSVKTNVQICSGKSSVFCPVLTALLCNTKRLRQNQWCFLGYCVEMVSEASLTWKASRVMSYQSGIVWAQEGLFPGGNGNLRRWAVCHPISTKFLPLLRIFISSRCIITASCFIVSSKPVIRDNHHQVWRDDFVLQPSWECMLGHPAESCNWPAAPTSWRHTIPLRTW